MKKMLAVFTLALFMMFGWAVAQEAEEATEAAVPAVTEALPAAPLDYRQVGALLAAALGGAGLTWAAKTFGAVKKGNPMKMYALSALFTFIAGVGTGVAAGLSWQDAGMMSLMGYLSQQGVYKAAKHRPAT